MGDLYWGDNLTILREYIRDETIDLVYLDPPFNSNRTYNVLFRESPAAESEAQIEAFSDTWHWGDDAEATYQYLANHNAVPQKVSDLVVALRSFVGSGDVMAYLVMMTVRLLELQRVLKPTGSIYLHCDPTASHYLKVIMDIIWGPRGYRNEIIWKRTTAHSDSRQGSRHYGRVHDVLLFFTNGDSPTWNPQFVPYDESYIRSHYSQVEPETGRRYRLDNLTGPGGAAKGNPQYEVMGVTRYWRYSRERMDELIRQGRVVQTRPGVVPAYKRYLDEMPGTPVGDVWTDIDAVNSQAAERLGYPTQKPEALLERIIRASSNPGDLVLDPFCGCGTAIAVAERLDRRWVGIDITHLAIAAIVSRLQAALPDVEIRRHGEPADLSGARYLADKDRYDFQNWALTLVAARPIAEDAKGKAKKGADRGIDGVISFLGADARTPHRCLVQVKSGHVTSATIRDLVGTVERERAELGLLITLETPTAPMRTEAVSAGYYHSDLMGRDYPRIQISTINELLHGREPLLPPRYSPYRLAERQTRTAQQQSLFEREA